MASNIHFFSEDTDFKIKHQRILKQWVKHIITLENQIVDDINFILCSDDYVLNINRQYLDHDYYTDIITFDNRESTEEAITADIFISIDRVRDNAEHLEIEFLEELHRVIIHGVLHLLGQGDKTEEQQNAMREREEASLSLLSIPKK